VDAISTAASISPAMADEFAPDIPEDGARGNPQVVLKAIRGMLPIDADIWQRQKSLRRISEADDALLKTERSTVPWAMIGFATGASAPAIWGKFFARPNWSRGFIVGVTVFTSTSALVAGQFAEAAGNLMVMRRCSNPQAVILAYQTAVREQIERERQKWRTGFQTERETARRKRMDEVVRKQSLETGSDSPTGDGWGESSEGMGRGPVTQELERQPNAWARSENGESAPQLPRPSPRSAGPRASTVPAPTSETEEPQESAWDSLRRGRLPYRKQRQQEQQQQEHSPRPPPVYDSETGDTPSYDTPIGLDDYREPPSEDDTARQKAQQDFDKLLEKERQFGQGEPGRRSSGRGGAW